MKYVIDTSVDIKTFVQEQDSSKALRLRNEYHNRVHELTAPDIFPTEMCNVLMILERSGKIKPGDADVFFRQFLSQLPPLVAGIPLLPRALEIAKQFRQTVYDCLYIALAEREACELVTADDKLVKAVQPTLPFVVSLSSLP
ncbi:MAG: type II toxin-antitoxin system VapC family toxin [Gemmataceae bacterium]|nr:type II toxin-antitoxin system VapC family toxin [Gemmataceae bacterium]MCI0743706.1 type II toxin-antitoxin system VapC family toxin [Gemmataceae bacterium]